MFLMGTGISKAWQTRTSFSRFAQHMMKVLVLIIALSASAGSDFLGYPSHYLNKPYFNQVQKMVEQANPDFYQNDSDAVARLSHEIVRVADCYQINPLIFSALIWRESNFNSAAKSHRGAVGLTQMTKIGVREVLEKISNQSPRLSRSLQQQVQRCHPEVLHRLSQIVTHEIITDEVVVEWKNASLNSSHDSLMLGAVLLKIKMKRALAKYLRERSSNGMLTHEDEWMIYQKAIEHYNGDAKVKARFAQDVMRFAGFENSLKSKQWYELLARL